MATNVQKLSVERYSNIFVILLTVLALILGWGVKASNENRTRLVEYGDISAEVPAGWALNEGEGSEVFSASDIGSGESYRVSLLSGNEGASLKFSASLQSLSRVNNLDSYVLLGESSGNLGDQEVLKTEFAFVDSNDGGLPIVVRGIDYYIPAGQQILVVTLEAPSHRYEEAIVWFENFLESISSSGGD